MKIQAILFKKIKLSNLEKYKKEIYKKINKIMNILSHYSKTN